MASPGSQARSGRFVSRVVAIVTLVAVGLMPARLPGDEVRIQNGDHYAGEVLSLTTNRLVLQSQALGRLTLARRQVSAIALAPGGTNLSAVAHAATNAEDEVWLQNGDRFAGQVLSLNTNALVLQSPILGRVSFSRCEVSSIALAAVATNHTALSLSATNSGPQATLPANLADGLRQLDLNGASIADIKSQFLNHANPAANKQFNDMLSGLMNGSLGVDDIRAQAQSVAAQARALRKDLGNDPGRRGGGQLPGDPGRFFTANHAHRGAEFYAGQKVAAGGRLKGWCCAARSSGCC